MTPKASSHTYETIFQNCAIFLRTDAHWIHKIKLVSLRMLILGQKPCFQKLSRNKKDLNDVTAAPFLMSFSQLPAAKKTLKTGQLWGPSYFVTTLEPTIFEIPQSKSNFLLCLAMAMNSGLLCPRWLYLHSQCAASDCEPRAATNATAVHASSRWAYSGGGLYGTSAACGVYGSQLFVLKATECQIQHPNVKVPAAFLFACIFPFLLVFFSSSDFRKKRITLCEVYWILDSYTRDLDLNQS